MNESSAKEWAGEPMEREWAEIPYFRKTPFVIAMFLLFSPAFLLIVWTGDTYYRRDGVVYARGPRFRRTLTIIIAVLFVGYLTRHSH